MYLVDSHCHLHDPEFFTPSQQIEFLKEAFESNVCQIICIGTSHADSLVAKTFAEAHENVFWTYGIHPEEATKKEDFKSLFEVTKENSRISREGHGRLRVSVESEGRLADRVGVRLDDEKNPTEFFQTKKELSKSSNLVAVGEIGLDYHYPGYDKSAQFDLLERMIDLAISLDLPCSFHVRDALPDFFTLVSNFPKLKPSVLHSFSDSKQNLEIALEKGFFIGINGLATFANLDCYKSLDPCFLDRIVLETDAPFLTPAPNRGKINRPSNVIHVARWLSDKFGVSSQEIAEKTTKNVLKIFNLPNPKLEQS